MLPAEASENRKKIKDEDFKTYGKNVLEAFQVRAAEQGIKSADPNYEGVRLIFPDGWALLRMSLHDPVMPLNVESRKAGGTAEIVKQLEGFLKDFDKLDLNALKK